MGSWRIPDGLVYNIVGSFAEFIRIPKAVLTGCILVVQNLV